MHPSAVILCTLLLAGAAVAATPATAGPAAHSFQELAVSPNGRWVASVEGDNPPGGWRPVLRDLVIRGVDGKAEIRVALPCGRVPQCWPSSPAWTPDSRSLSFALRTPGGHARSLYRVGADGVNPVQVLAFDGTIDGLRYDRRGRLAVLATAGATKELGAVEAGAPDAGDLDQPPPEQRIALVEGGALRWVSPPELFVYEYDWIPDGSGFVATAAPGDGDKNWWTAKLYSFGLGKASSRVLYTPASARQQLAAPVVSPDGTKVAFIAGIMSDFGSTGGDVHVLSLAGGTAENIMPQSRVSVTAIEWRCDGHLLALGLAADQTLRMDFGAASGARTPAFLWSAAESIDATASNSGPPCGRFVTAEVHESFSHAQEIQIDTAGRRRDLTAVNAGLKSALSAQSVTWHNEGFDVQGWLLLPDPLPATVKLPMIVDVHGGPAAAHQPVFLPTGDGRTPLEHGYAVFQPNPRGSFGQGEAFVLANVRDLGGGDLRDILTGVAAVAHVAPVDPARVGIMGHSYGGFMTMFAVSQTDFFKAAVAGAGISNWQSYYGENGIDEWMIPYFGASVYEDPAVYAKSSAINFIRRVKTPTFSYVGALDIECPAPQTQEFGHALKALGVPSSTVIYPGEGHAIQDPEHLADIERRTLAWFDRYLK
jgi:dipeptidyl aminopeptidase/acylaminoacyl peptidase